MKIFTRPPISRKSFAGRAKQNTNPFRCKNGGAKLWPCIIYDLYYNNKTVHTKLRPIGDLHIPSTVYNVCPAERWPTVCAERHAIMDFFLLKICFRNIRIQGHHSEAHHFGRMLFHRLFNWDGSRGSYMLSVQKSHPKTGRKQLAFQTSRSFRICYIKRRNLARTKKEEANWPSNFRN